MHRTGRRPAVRALAWAGALALGSAAVAGCTVQDREPAPEGTQTPGAAEQTGVPQVDRDGYDPLTVHLVAPVWSAPPETTGVRVGCQDQDLLVAVETVPTQADDPADMAMDFLLQDSSGTHGDPALTNAVAASAKTLTYTGHRREGDAEVFEFAGTVTVEDACGAERVRAQLMETARANVDAEEVRVTVDGEDIDDVLGLLPYEPGEEYTAPPAEEEASEDPAPGEDDLFGDPGAPASPSEPQWQPEEPVPSEGPSEDPGEGVPSLPGVEPSEPGWQPEEPVPGESPSGVPGEVPGEGIPSLPGVEPSYGVETQPVLPPTGP